VVGVNRQPIFLPISVKFLRFSGEIDARTKFIGVQEYNRQGIMFVKVPLCCAISGVVVLSGID
jgi:hypothetical protein